MGKDNCCDVSDEHSQVEDIAVQVEKAIKALPTLQQKVQAIAINGYLEQKKKLDDELEKQLALAQIRYFQLYAPFLTKINQIVEGTRELTEADFEEGVLGLLTQQELDLKKNYLKPEKFKGYWNKVIINSQIGQQVKEKDQPILEHLYRIQAEKNDTQTSLTVKFYFSQNQWFTNTILTKQFTLDGQEIVKSDGDIINWKEGKNITVKIVKKKQKNKKTGEKKTTSKQIKQQSFFHFFTNIDGEHQHDEDEDDQQHNKQIQQLQNQYQIADTIFQELIPYSLQYYLGVGGGFGQQGMQGLEDIEQIEDQQQQQEVKPKKKKNKKETKADEAEDNKSKSKSKSKGKDKGSKGKQAKGTNQPTKQQCKQQ